MLRCIRVKANSDKNVCKKRTDSLSSKALFWQKASDSSKKCI